MAGYMEGYGATDARREKWFQRIFGIGLPVVLVCLGAFYYLRTWPQERAMSSFIETLGRKDYSAAYSMWCTDQRPCGPNYTMDRFMKDWGPEGEYRDASKLKFGSIDYCGQGVVFETMYPNAETFGLWVERGTNTISFAPDRRCPGKHLQFGAIFKRIFG